MKDFQQLFPPAFKVKVAENQALFGVKGTRVRNRQKCIFLKRFKII
jgi:hypothetical protein